MIIFCLPLKFELRDEDWNRLPLIAPNPAVKLVVRIGAIALLAFALVSMFICLSEREGHNKASDRSLYVMGIAVVASMSWICLTAYAFGVQTLLSEKALAISRHPIFLFRRDLLEIHLSRTVYVRLLDERLEDFRPAPAKSLGRGVFKLLPSLGNKPEDEKWEFGPGSIVRCEKRELEGQQVWVAVKAC